MRRSVVGGLAMTLLASSALAAPTAQVTLRANAKGVVASFVLPKAVDRFVFDEKADDVRDDAWHAPAGMVLDDGVLKRVDGKAFASFAIQITPDTAPRDRRYPALTRIGDGWQVYGPYLAGEKVAAPVAVVTTPKGWTALPRKAGGKVALDGYVYLGPSNLVSAGAATVVVAPNVSRGLRGQIVRIGEGATAYYTRRLGVSPAATPILLVARVPEFNEGWQGDAVPGTMMSLRFFGPGGGETEDEDKVTGFVSHEFFHFWNSGLYHSRDGEGDAWLHEGAADYAAMLASRELGTRTDAGMAEALGQRLTDCASALKDKGLTDNPPKQGKAVYDCGVVAQWAADLKLRAASGGKRDVLDAWKDVFAYAKAGDQRYDVKGFLAAAGMTEAADDPLRLLMQRGEAGRWDNLVAAMIRLGARLEPGRSNAADRKALLITLLEPTCKGSFGFTGGDGPYLRLDTGDRCEGAKGDPKIDAVAGRDIVGDASRAFDAVAALCASGSGDVPLSYQGKVVATLPCRKLPSPPQAWTVSKWR